MIAIKEENSQFEVNFVHKFEEFETIEFWMKINSEPNAGSSHELISQNNHFSLKLGEPAGTGLEVLFEIVGHSPSLKVTLAAGNFNEWHHYSIKIALYPVLSAMSLDADTIVDSYDTVTLPTVFVFTDFTGEKIKFIPAFDIGAAPIEVGIREMAIWNELITVNQMRSRLRTWLTPKYESLLFYLRLDEGAGTYIYEQMRHVEYTVNEGYWCDSCAFSLDNRVIPMPDVKNATKMTSVLTVENNAAANLTLNLGTVAILDRFTAMLWIRFDTIFNGTGDGVVDGGLENFVLETPYFRLISINTMTRKKIFLYVGRDVVFLTDKEIIFGQWTNLAVVRFDFKTCVAYVNGDKDLFPKGGTTHPDLETAVGIINISTPVSVKVMLRDIKIFKKEMGDGELYRNIYWDTSPQHYHESLFIYYRLDEGIGTTVYNSAPMNPKELYTADTELFMSSDLSSISGNMRWVTTEGPSTCRSQEFHWNLSNSSPCEYKEKALHFKRGLTTDAVISILPLSMEFTFETWVRFERLGEGEVGDVILSDIFDLQLEFLSGPEDIISYTVKDGLEVTVASKSLKHSLGNHNGDWVHVGLALCRNLERSVLTVNGVEVVRKGHVLTNRNVDRINITSQGNGFTGQLRQIRIWNTYRSSGQIGIDSRRHFTHIGVDALLGIYWPLDEGTGYTIFDISKSRKNYEFEGNRTELPMWVTVPLPRICYGETYYNSESGECNVKRRAAHIGEADIPIMAKYQIVPEWTIRSWIKMGAGDTGKVGINVGAVEVMSAVFTPPSAITINVDQETPIALTRAIATDTWYAFSLSYKYNTIPANTPKNAIRFLLYDRFGVNIGIYEETVIFHSNGFVGQPILHLEHCYLRMFSLWKRFLIDDLALDTFML